MKLWQWFDDGKAMKAYAIYNPCRKGEERCLCRIYTESRCHQCKVVDRHITWRTSRR